VTVTETKIEHERAIEEIHDRLKDARERTQAAEQTPAEETEVEGHAPPAPSETYETASPERKLEWLQEAARRANWDAKHGPRHLRTGRFK
jgi:hypothetical protein